jgi:Tol biopolymer transport system component
MKKYMLFITVIVLLFLSFASSATQNGYDLFQKALAKERGEGNLEEAIALYKKVVAETKDESLAAKAQLRIGICYEKLGMKEARKAFQKVIDNYPGQTETVKVAKEKLALLLRALAVVEKGEKEFKITKIPIDAYLAFISPDGKKMACVSERGDIWVREISSGKDIRLTQTPIFDYWCFWSFDSKTIAYLDVMNGLHVISAKGGESKTLIKADSEFRKTGNYAWPVSWTPDNQMLICHVSSRGLCAIPISGGEWKDIFKFSDQEQEKDYGLLRLSPNGKLIAYNSKKAGNDDIYVMPAEGGESIQITHHPAPDLNPHWSFDGKWLAYETLRTGEREIWVVKTGPDGKPESKPFRVVKGTANPNVSGTIYNWTKDGKLGISTRMSFSNIFTVDPKSKEEVQLTDVLSGNKAPRWSPDGSHLVFISDRGGKRNIWTMHSNGGEPRLVTGNITHPSFFLYMHSPAWSPDGKNIAFGIYYGVGGDRGIWIVPAEGGPVKKIKFDYEGSVHAIDWSPDGKQIAFSYSRGKDEKNPIPGSRLEYRDIYLIPVDGGEPARVTKTDKEMIDFRIPRWSPDGKKIAALCCGWPEEKRGKDESGIFIVDIERGKIDMIAESIKNTWHGLSWTPDGENVIFSGWREGKLYLQMVSSRGGEIKNLNIEGLEPDYSPDGKKIVFSRGTGARKEFWLVENFLPEEKTGKKSK